MGFSTVMCFSHHFQNRCWQFFETDVMAEEKTKLLQSIANDVHQDRQAQVETALQDTVDEIHYENEAVLSQAATVAVEEPPQATPTNTNVQSDKTSIKPPEVDPPTASKGSGKSDPIRADDPMDSDSSDDDNNNRTPTATLDDDRYEDDDDDEEEDVPTMVPSNGAESKLMMRAVYRGNVTEVETYLQDIDPDTADQHGWTGLHWAVSQKNKKLIQLFLTHHTHVNGRELTNGWTPLHLAAIAHSVSSVKRLIKAGASLQAKDHVS